MSYLIDTNVLSELRRREPDIRVQHWFADRSNNSLYLSVLTLGELRKGIAKMPASPRQEALLSWLEAELPRFFFGRILPVDALVADTWGQITAQTSRPLPAIDSLLAATAMTHRLTLVTRNVRDFQWPGLSVVNPWA